MGKFGVIATSSAAALSMCLAGCGSGSSGGGGGAAATAYATKICDALSSGLGAVKKDTTAYTKLAQKDGTGENLARLKQATVTFLGQTVAQLSDMKSAIANDGTPPTSDGATEQAALVSAFGKLVTHVNAAKSDIAATSISNPQVFARRLETDGSALETIGKTIGNSLNGLDSSGDQALDKAFSNDPACSSLQSS